MGYESDGAVLEHGTCLKVMGSAAVVRGAGGLEGEPAVAAMGAALDDGVAHGDAALAVSLVRMR